MVTCLPSVVTEHNAYLQCSTVLPRKESRDMFGLTSTGVVIALAVGLVVLLLLLVDARKPKRA